MDSKESDEEISWTCWLRTILAGFGAMTLFMFLGINEAQSSVMLPQLRKPDSNIYVTRDEETWIASLGYLLAPLFAVITGPFLDVFGRKKGLQIFYLTASLGYAVISLARDFNHICIGRIICGLGVGQITVATVYLAEICTIKQREYMLAVLSGIFSFGVTLACTIGGYLPWNIASSIYSITAFIIFLGVSFVPESPAWLVKMGREEDSVVSFKKLGRKESAIVRELEILTRKDKQKVEWATFFEPQVWKPFCIMVVFHALQSLSGIFDLLYYSVDFIQSLGTKYDALGLTVLLATFRLINGWTVVLVFRSKVSRKCSLATSCFGMTVAFVGIGTYEFVQKDVPVFERSYQWLIVAFLLLYMLSSSLGMLGLPSIMCGEVYPLKVRGIMAGTTTAIGNCFIFVSIKVYYMFVDLFRVYGLVLFYAAFSFAAFFFAIFVLPETRNKSLYEIEQSFLPKEKRRLSLTKESRRSF